MTECSALITDRKCENCGGEIPRIINGRAVPEALYVRRRFCSRSCMAQARERNWGRIAKQIKCEHCDKAFMARGHHKEEARFCSVACRVASGNMGMRGAAHPNWKGGRTEENIRLRNTAEYKRWASSVYERDRWACQKCGERCRKGNIIAHHLKGFREFPELRYDVGNGQTLCRPCHKQVHDDVGEGTRFGVDGRVPVQPSPDARRITNQRIAAEYAQANGFAEDRKCQHCGEIFPRNRSENGRIKDWHTYNKRRFCSRTCRNNARFAASTPEERSAAYAEEHGFKEDKCCEQCGSVFPRANGGPKGTIESWAQYRERKYCSLKCGAMAREAAAVAEKGYAEDRNCEECGASMFRKIRPSGEVESWTQYNRRKCCSRSCHMKSSWRKRSAGTESEKAPAASE